MCPDCGAVLEWDDVQEVFSCHACGFESDMEDVGL